MDQSDVATVNRNAQPASAFELWPAGCVLTNESLCVPEDSYLDLGMLLPNRQVMELEKRLRTCLTTGQLLRRLIWIYLSRTD